jgi:signal transduction histidine kinase
MLATALLLGDLITASKISRLMALTVLGTGVAIFGGQWFARTTARLCNRLTGVAPLRAENARLYAQLAVAQQQANIAEKLRASFIAGISHQLRTPLNAIVGFSSLMKDEIHGPHAEPAYREYADAVFDGGQQLLSVINQVIELTELQAEMPIETDTIDMTQLVRAVVRQMSPIAAMCDIRIDVAATADPQQLLVAGDAAKLQCAVRNLLTSVLRTMEPGQRIEISTRSHDADVEIEITGGCGFGADELALLLQPFCHPVGSGHGVLRDDMGLAFPLAKTIVERHCGKLAIDSQPGSRGRIGVQLPRHEYVLH